MVGRRRADRRRASCAEKKLQDLQSSRIGFSELVEALLYLASLKKKEAKKKNKGKKKRGKKENEEEKKKKLSL